MTNEQVAIWKYLRNNAMGLDNAKKIETIASSIGELPYGTNNDNVRKWIGELVIDYQKPIGSYKKGVFIVTNEEEKEIAVNFVDRKSRADFVRSNGIYEEE